jgi:hypothetical protein
MSPIAAGHVLANSERKTVDHDVYPTAAAVLRSSLKRVPVNRALRPGVRAAEPVMLSCKFFTAFS